MRAARADQRRFLDAARTMGEEVDRFARDIEAAPESKLAVAVEELRAQNEALREACVRLERQSAKYQHLYDNAPDALVTTDDRGVIVDANPPVARLFGYPHDMMPGKLLIGFVARRDTVPFRDHLHSIVQGSGQGMFSVRMRPRGGAPFLAHLSVRAVQGTVRPVRGPRPASTEFHWTIRVGEGERAQQENVYDLLETVLGELRPLASNEKQKAGFDRLGALLAFARDVEPPSVVDLEEVAVHVIARVRPVAHSRSVNLEIERGGGDARTTGRAHQLVWALEQLIAGAIQGPSSLGEICVRVDGDELGPFVHVRSRGAHALDASRLTVDIARAVIERHGGALRLPGADEEDVLLHARFPRPAGSGLNRRD